MRSSSSLFLISLALLFMTSRSDTQISYICELPEKKVCTLYHSNISEKEFNKELFYDGKELIMDYQTFVVTPQRCVLDRKTFLIFPYLIDFMHEHGRIRINNDIFLKGKLHVKKHSVYGCVIFFLLNPGEVVPPFEIPVRPAKESKDKAVPKKKIIL